MGKTKTAQSNREQAPEWRLFDPEHVGLLLEMNLVGLDFDDFQELPPWRSLVLQIAQEISALTGDSLLAVKSLLGERYSEEMQNGFRDRQMEVIHVLLDTPAQTLERRIKGDQIDRGAEQWRLNHIASYESAKSWLNSRADLVVDTAARDASEAASYILESLK